MASLIEKTDIAFIHNDDYVQSVSICNPALFTSFKGNFTISLQLKQYSYNMVYFCCRYINGTRLDDRIIRCDWDAGFIEGRQYGRGKTGGQVAFFCYLRSNGVK